MEVIVLWLEYEVGAQSIYAYIDSVDFGRRYRGPQSSNSNTSFVKTQWNLVFTIGAGRSTI